MAVLVQSEDGASVLETWGRPELVVAGHSHVGAIWQALVQANDRTANTGVALGPLEQAIRPDSDYWAFVRSCFPDSTLAILWGGNEHNVVFAVEYDPPVRVWPDVDQGTNNSGTWVPRSAVREMYADSTQLLSTVLSSVCSVRRTVVVGTPPPKEQARMTKALSTESALTEHATRYGSVAIPIRASQNSLRRTAWELLQQELRSVAQSHGAMFVESSELACTSSGMLVDHYCEEDATHANSAYGLLVLQKLKEVMMW